MTTSNTKTTEPTTCAPTRWRFSLRGLLLAITLFSIFLGILFGLVAPAVRTAREAARRMQASNNVKQIMLAMHNYHDANDLFPPAITRDASGKTMFGWRFAIVPYIESTDLYSRFDHRLPWDAPGNLAIVQFPFYVYTRPGQLNKVPSATNFVAITGPGTLFPDDDWRTLGHIKDGPENTIVVVEIGPSDIPWYEPRDLRIDTMSFRINDPDRSKPCIGSRLSRGAIVGFADGHVALLPEDTQPEKLRAMLTIAEGD